MFREINLQHDLAFEQDRKNSVLDCEILVIEMGQNEYSYGQKSFDKCLKQY